MAAPLNPAVGSVSPRPVAVPRAGVGAGYMLLALTVAMTLAFLDRQLINLVVDPIRTEVAISDTQFSLLQGAAFSLVYTVAMMPIAWAADHFSRKALIIASIVAWSVMTICFGLAGGFAALLLMRAGVAIGEAGLSPAAVSLLRDSFPRHRQAAAISVLSLGVYIGGAISLSAGGPALSWLEDVQRHTELPWGLSPWRLLFVGAGTLGVVAAALLLFMREPPRAPVAGENAGWGEYFRLARAIRAPVVAYLCAYTGIFALATAAPAWMPALFMRAHDWSAHTVGLYFGVIHLIGGALGALGGGWIVDRLTSQGHRTAQPQVVRWGVVAIGIGSILTALLPDPRAALAASGLAVFGAGVCVGLGAMGFQAMFPVRFSARGVATYMLVTGVLGASFGPTAIPLLAAWFGDGDNIAPAMAAWSVVATIWAVGWLSWLIKVVGERDPQPGP